MKNVIYTLLGFSFLMIGCAGAISIIISALIGGGVSETFLYPIYAGVIALSGLVMGCTCSILKEIRLLRNEIKNMDKDKDKDKEEDESNL